MGVLVDGVWHEDDRALQSSDGTCANPITTFRERISIEGKFSPEAGRYHLYVAYGCPFAHRTLILRNVKKLQDKISVSIVHPVNTSKGWKFEEFAGSTLDELYGSEYLSELYVRADNHFTGKVSVPVLWDKQTHTIVNNESSDIAEMLNEFPADQETQDFYPVEKREEIDRLVNRLKDEVILKVYKVGYAGTQEDYERQVNELFETLDWLEEHLGKSRYLLGDRITLADWFLFPVVFRFDYAMYSLFKCNIRRIVDYSNIFEWARELYKYPGVEETCNLRHIFMTYWAMKKFNPSGIYPVGPLIDWSAPHSRDRDYSQV